MAKKSMTIKKKIHEFESGSDLLLELLALQNVDLVFGYPGGTVLPLYDAVYRKSFNNILVRHEQAAVHAAEGYAKVSGKPGVVFVTSGPGATNTVTGITDAMLDSVPLVVFTGQVARAAIGTDAFQEVDILSVTAPITKQNYQVRDLSQLPRVVQEAFELAAGGRPGPVLIDLPKDIASDLPDDFAFDSQAMSSVKPVRPAQDSFDKHEMSQMCEALLQAKKPLILAGAGVANAHAVSELKRFARRFDIPVVSTLMSLGAFAANDPLFLGMAGMHGSYQANMALSECDFLLNIGSRFDDRVATSPAQFAPHARIGHIDIDHSELEKIIPTEFPITADARRALTWLLHHTQDRLCRAHTAWLAQLDNWKQRKSYQDDQQDGQIHAKALIEEIGRLTDGDATIVTDVGQHQMWTAQYYPFKRPHQLITSGGLGTMGFGLPAAIGAKLADPSQEVVLIAGDGGIQMTIEELDLIREYDLDIKVVVLNNQALGMVRQWQDLFYKKRRSQTVFHGQPDFIKLAQAYSIKGVKLDQQNWRETLADVFAKKESVLLEAAIPALEQVYPMVAPGQPNQNMIGVE